MFIDEADIQVTAGNGGAGACSFRREKHEPLGGPDGGDGGDGGDVILRAALHVETLLDFKGRHHIRAEHGQAGSGKQCTGRCGADRVVELPVGTLVYDRSTGVLIKDLSAEGVVCVVAAGGRGGRGNSSFTTATQQAPREFEVGEAGSQRELHLELKLIADVGLVGLPNAGKSTLLAACSAARPKIAAYPFTTLKPQLGIVAVDGERRFVMADIPGLIEGAHTGAGLGDAFLKHIERTRVILHLVDVCPLDGSAPEAAYETIRSELAAYSPALAAKPELVVASKTDLTATNEPVELFARAIGKPVHPISAVTQRGLGLLLEQVWDLLGPTRAEPPQAPALPTPPHRKTLT